MKRSFPLFALAGCVALSVMATACSSDIGSETGPQGLQQGSPASPSPAAPRGPQADNRRSFIWSSEAGFTILQNPPGVILVSADGINDAGDVCGTVIMGSETPGPLYRAFKWSKAAGFTFFPGVETTNSYATGLDDDGNVVGYTESRSLQSVDRNVAVWDKSNRLRSLDVRLPFLHSLGIGAGWIFGTALGSNRSTPYRMNIASGKLEPLPALSEVGGGVVQVNASGAAVGFDGYIDYGFGGFSDAVAWDDDGTRTVALSCAGEWNCFASLKGINANGVAVGMVTREAGTRMFRWTRSSGVEYLSDPSGADDTSRLVGITDNGSILGSNRRMAFIIKPSGASTFFTAPEGYSLIQPRAISNSGQVVGMLF